MVGVAGLWWIERTLGGGEVAVGDILLAGLARVGSEGHEFRDLPSHRACLQLCSNNPQMSRYS